MDPLFEAELVRNKGLASIDDPKLAVAVYIEIGSTIDAHRARWAQAHPSSARGEHYRRNPSRLPSRLQ